MLKIGEDLGVMKCLLIRTYRLVPLPLPESLQDWPRCVAAATVFRAGHCPARRVLHRGLLRGGFRPHPAVRPGDVPSDASAPGARGRAGRGLWHRRVPRSVPRCRRARPRRRTGDRGAGAVPGQGAGGRPGRPIEGTGVTLDRRPGLQLRGRRAHPRGGGHRVRQGPDRRGASTSA